MVAILNGILFMFPVSFNIQCIKLDKTWRISILNVTAPNPPLYVEIFKILLFSPFFQRFLRFIDCLGVPLQLNGGGEKNFFKKREQIKTNYQYRVLIVCRLLKCCIRKQPLSGVKISFSSEVYIVLEHKHSDGQIERMTDEK